MPGRLADDLVRPVFQTSIWFWAVVLAAGTVVACGAAAWGYELWYGIGVSGKRSSMTSADGTM